MMPSQARFRSVAVALCLMVSFAGCTSIATVEVADSPQPTGAGSESAEALTQVAPNPDTESSNQGDSEQPASSEDNEAEPEGGTLGGALSQDGVDVVSCQVVTVDDEPEVLVELVNSSEIAKNVFANAEGFSADGEALGSERLSGLWIRPGERAILREYFTPVVLGDEPQDPPATCRATDIEGSPARDGIPFNAGSIALDPFSCEVVGLDGFGDLTVEIVIDGPESDQPQRYQWLVAFERDGTRVGTALPTAAEVITGSSTVQVNTFTKGPADGLGCTVLWANSADA